MKQIYSINDISKLEIPIKLPSIIFLKGDLGAGKTTISKHIINNLLGVTEEITSPTYTYYNKYTANKSLELRANNGPLSTNNGQMTTIYHFDLYRLSDYDEFFAIGGEDILDNNNGIILIEWPEVIEKYYSPDLEIILKKTEKEDEREIDVVSSI